MNAMQDLQSPEKSQSSLDAAIQAQTEMAGQESGQKISYDGFVKVLAYAQERKMRATLCDSLDQRASVAEAKKDPTAALLSMERLYQTAAELGFDRKTIDEAISRFALTREQRIADIIKVDAKPTHNVYVRRWQAEANQLLQDLSMIFQDALPDRRVSCTMTNRSLWHSPPFMMRSDTDYYIRITSTVRNQTWPWWKRWFSFGYTKQQHAYIEFDTIQSVATATAHDPLTLRILGKVSEKMTASNLGKMDILHDYDP